MGEQTFILSDVRGNGKAWSPCVCLGGGRGGAPTSTIMMVTVSDVPWRCQEGKRVRLFRKSSCLLADTQVLWPPDSRC